MIGQLKANGCDIQLYGNKGFTLSSNISAVKNATKLDFSSCDLSGASKGMTRHTLANNSQTLACAGELPLELIRIKAKGCEFKLGRNKPGFTLPSNIGELGDDITKLDLGDCYLRGAFVEPGIPRAEAN